MAKSFLITINDFILPMQALENDNLQYSFHYLHIPLNQLDGFLIGAGFLIRNPK